MLQPGFGWRADTYSTDIWKSRVECEGVFKKLSTNEDRPDP